MPWSTLLLLLLGIALGAAGALTIGWFLLRQRTDRAIAARDAQLLALRRELGVLQHKNLRLSRKGANLELLEGENARLRTAVADYESSSRKHQDELKRMRGNLDRMGQELDAQFVELEELRGQLAASNRRYEDLKGQFEVMIDRFTDVQRLRQNVVVATQMLKREQAHTAELQARLDALGAQDVAEPAAADVDLANLEVVKGIGPQMARRLHDSGIHTLEDLAHESPERVARFAGLLSWQQEESAAWIAEAKRVLASTRRPRA